MLRTVRMDPKPPEELEGDEETRTRNMPIPQRAPPRAEDSAVSVSSADVMPADSSIEPASAVFGSRSDDRAPAPARPNEAAESRDSAEMFPSARSTDAGLHGPPSSAKSKGSGFSIGATTSQMKIVAQRCPSCEKAFSGEARFCPYDGDPLEPAPDWNPSADPLLGQIIDGRYEVVEVIGEGGMGTVYEVKHTSLGRRFAMKILRRDIADEVLTARFIQEAKAAAAIGHPNIVAVSDFGEVLVGKSKMPYFVMEFLVGISLAQLLKMEGTVAPQRLVEIIAQAASALAAAHKAGVIHRDLKPDNVFITRTGDKEFIKLLDFGVAKIAGAGRLTKQGMVFGTPHYMSPEQASGHPVDHRADIYALGIILYECLTGHVPFEADSFMGVLTKHMFATPEPIELRASNLASLGGLGPIVMRCLSKNPSERYADMTELAQALEHVRADPEDAATRALGEPKRGDLHLRATGDNYESGNVTLDEPAIPMRPSGARWVIGGIAIAAALGFLAWRFWPSNTASTEARVDASATPPVASAPPATAAASAPVAPAASASVAAGSASAPASAAVSASAPATSTSAKAPASSKPPPKGPSKPPPSTPRKNGEIVNPWGK